MDAIHAQLDLFLTGGTYHNATCRYGNYVHPDQPLYPARIQAFSFSQELPDPLIGGLAKRSATITLSDHDVARLDSPTLAAILATENPKGKLARLRLWDPESGTVVNTLNGIISSIGQDYNSLTIEGENPALLQNLLPTTRALDIYPSLDTSQMESRDPPPIVVFGIMPRVTLGVALATSLSFTAQMGGGEPDKYVYADMTDIPNYTVASGDRLVYDIFHGGAGYWQALDLRCSDGTLLRTAGALDQNGLNAQPSTDLDAYAHLKWYRRDIDLAPLVGKTITEYLLGSDNNTEGSYTSTIANAYILDATEVKKVAIFDETILAVPLTYQLQNNAASIVGTSIDRNWYYGPIRPAASGTLSVTAVYVDGRVRAAGTYSFATAGNGYRLVRFSERPQASQGGAAKVQADFNSTEFVRNPATIAKFVWQNATMLGQPVNTASFTAAAAIYAGIGDYEKVVGGLTERKQALQVLRDLSFRGAYFDLNDSNEVTMTVDASALHTSAPVNLGQQDDLNLRNAEVSANNSLSNSIASEPKQLDFLAYRDPGLGSSGQSSYLISATRSRSTGGVTITRESPYCGSGRMADRETGYLFVALVSNDFDIEVITGVTIGKQLSLGQLVKFYSPKHYFSGLQYTLRGLRFDGKQYTLRLTGWDPALFTYTPGKVTASRLVDAVIDYSQTAPSTPTSPFWVSSTVMVGDDGAALVIEKFRVTLPSVNCTELRLLAYRTGTGQAAPFQTVSRTSITLGAQNDIEIQVPVRMVYDLEFYAYNGRNQPEAQYSLPALMTGRIAATDTSAPSVPTGLTATVGTGKIVSLNWNDNPEIDTSEYVVYRGPSDPPTTKIAEVAASRFVDVDVAIGTLYFYAVSSVDRTENESAKSAVVQAIPVLIPGGDTSTIAPNTPGAPTFDSEGTYFSKDGASFAFIEVNNPTMPTNGVVMNILYRSTGTAAWSIADQVNAGGGNSRVDDLIPDRDYVFAAQAYSVFGRGSLISATLARTAPHDTSGPSVPTGLVATVGTGKVVSLDWNDSTAIDFSEYRVYRGPSDPPTTKIAEVAASRFVDVNVAFDTLYVYAISAVDRTENESAKSAVVEATPVLIPGGDTSTVIPNTPSAPTLFSEGTYLAADGASVAFIEVNNPAMPTNGAVMNILYRPNGTVGWSIADQVNEGIGRSRVDDLTPGRAYQFAVQAFSVFGRGSVVSTVLARTAPFDTSAPGVPTLLSCDPFNQRAILVDWTDVTSSDLSEYALYRQSFINLVGNYGFEEFEFAGWTKSGTPGGGESFAQLGIHSGARAAEIVSLGTPLLLIQTIPITNGATYTLAGWARITSRTSGTAVIRVETGGGGTYVTAVSLSAVGGWIFGDVTFVATGTTATVQCYVTGGPLTGYFDDIALFAGTPSPTTKIAEVRASRFTDSEFFLVGTVYYYAVAAIDRTENESAKSNFLAATPVRISNEDLSKFTPQPLGPLLMSSSGTYQSNDGTTLAFANITWTNPTDANRAYIEVAYRRNGNTTSYLIADQVTGASARVDDLTPGLAYDYRVRGLSQVGVFGTASTLANQVAPGDTTAPAQVTGLTLSDHPPRGILARWTAVSADDLAGYQIQSATNSGFTTALITRTAKTTELPATGLTNGTNYFFRVRGLDLTGNAGTYSSTMSRIVPRNATDDYDDESITTLKVGNLAVTNAKIANLAVDTAKIADLSVTNAKIGALAVDNAKIANLAVTNAKIANLAVDNAKINDLSAVKITTGLLTINPSVGGATALFVDNAGKIRLKMISGTPSQIVFEDTSGVERAAITGSAGGISISPISDATMSINIGQTGRRWSVVNIHGVDSTTVRSDDELVLFAVNGLRLFGQIYTDQVLAGAPAGAATKHIDIYNTGGTFQGRIPVWN